MNDKTNKRILYVVISCAIAVAGVVGVFIGFFYDLPFGDPTDFANFATYFGNMVMPVLTAASVFALVLTLKHQHKQYQSQQNQFNKQQNMLILMSYLERFDKQYQKYLEHIQKEFPSPPFRGENKDFSIADYHSYDENSWMKKFAEISRDNLKCSLDSKLVRVGGLEERIKNYIDQLEIEARVALLTIERARVFTDDDTKDFTNEMVIRGSEIIATLQIWHIFSEDEATKQKEAIGLI